MLASTTTATDLDGPFAPAEPVLRTFWVRRRRRPGCPAFGWDSLTEAELKVTRLVVEGLTNRSIGERLFVSRRTVETHVSHALAKLGLTTRIQLAVEAARRLG